MTLIQNSQLVSAHSPAEQWFAPGGAQFVVDVDAGSAFVEVRRDEQDDVPKRIGTTGCIHAPQSVVVDVPIPGRQYRIVPATAGTAASAHAAQLVSPDH